MFRRPNCPSVIGAWMHERTERAVARLLFVFCCAVPTSFVMLAILISWTPWFQARRLAELEYQLGRESGLVFDIESCHQTSPGKFELSGVRISDPDSGRQIATVRLIDYYVDDSKRSLQLHQPELESAGLGVAWTKLHDRLISSPQHTMIPISIVSTRLNIISSTGSLELEDLRATVKPETDGVHLIAEVGDAAQYSETHLRFELFRDRNVMRNGLRDLPETEVIFSTEDTALRCSVLADYLPIAKSLGPDATVRGSLKCRQSPKGWHYEIGPSTLSQVNLTQLSEMLPHPVRGLANIRIAEGSILPGQSIDLFGSIHSERCGVQPPLLARLEDRLAMSIKSAYRVEPTGFLDLELGVHFELRDSAMKLTGICDASEVGIAMRSPRGLTVRTHQETLPADQLITAMQPAAPFISSWNQVLLPSTLPAEMNAAPVARIGSLDRSSEDPQAMVRQPESRPY